jgi:hypothetical protein
MKVAELAKVAGTSVKVMSAYNDKVLCHRFDPEKHKEIGEREVKAVWADFKSSGCGYYKAINPILCVYADGSEECYKAHPF